MCISRPLKPVILAARRKDLKKHGWRELSLVVRHRYYRFAISYARIFILHRVCACAGHVSKKKKCIFSLSARMRSVSGMRARSTAHNSVPINIDLSAWKSNSGWFVTEGPTARTLSLGKGPHSGEQRALSAPRRAPTRSAGWGTTVSPRAAHPRNPI